VLLHFASDSIDNPPAIGCQYGSRAIHLTTAASERLQLRREEVAKIASSPWQADQLSHPPAWVTPAAQVFFTAIRQCFLLPTRHTKGLPRVMPVYTSMRCSMRSAGVSRGMTTAGIPAPLLLWIVQDVAGTRLSSSPQPLGSLAAVAVPDSPEEKAHRQFAGIGIDCFTVPTSPVEYLLLVAFATASPCRRAKTPAKRSTCRWGRVEQLLQLAC